MSLCSLKSLSVKLASLPLGKMHSSLSSEKRPLRGVLKSCSTAWLVSRGRGRGRGRVKVRSCSSACLVRG